MLVIHRVESHHALHVCGRELEDFGDLSHRVFGDPASHSLHDPERRQKRRHLRGITPQQSVELLARSASEYRNVRLVPMTVVRREIGRLDAGHRSISPITMSMLALIAITSDSRCPSTIFGIAERLMKDGGLILQRTGFDVPSETM